MLTEKLGPIIEEHSRRLEKRSFAREVKPLVVGTFYGVACALAVYILT